MATHHQVVADGQLRSSASRMLRALEGHGLITVTPSAADARVRVARLTPKGLAERAVLDERSGEVAASILNPLDAAQRRTRERDADRRTADGDVAHRVCDRSIPRALTPNAVCARTWRSSIAAHRSEASTRARARPRTRTRCGHRKGAFVLAYLRGEAIGCGAVKHQPDRVTDIKRMWVAESARGLGLGRRLLDHLEHLAREHGSSEAHFETSDVLPEAIALYQSSGYVEVPPFNDEPFADRWFAKRLLDNNAPSRVPQAG